MARGVNRVFIIGNLGADPEIRYTQNGTAVANLSVATTERFKDKQTGEQREHTEWHRCTAYRRTAEICGEYLKKGSQVYIEGKLKTRKWQAQDGGDRYTTEIVINDLQMLDSAGGGQQGQQNQQRQQKTQQQQQYSGQNQQQPNPQQQSQQFDPDSDFDDAIPF